MNYRIDITQYTPRELYLMWLIHINPGQFATDNALALLHTRQGDVLIPNGKEVI